MAAVGAIVGPGNVLLRIVSGVADEIQANADASKGEQVIFAPDFDPEQNPTVDYMPLLIAAGVVIPPPPYQAPASDDSL